jgi:mannose-6-phosphate isomerase-like protein (cupin superfamily)
MMPRIVFTTLLMFCAIGQTTFAALPEDSPDGVAGVRYYNGLESADRQEVVPPGGFFFSFMQGPNSTFAITKTAEGKGRALPVRINRHNEETGIVIKGSVLFKAGYNGEFQRVLRVGDTIIIPKCVPHSGLFGWDHNEETILVTTFTDKYVEYGPDNTGKTAKEFSQKVNYKSNSGPAETADCRNMKNAPKITWTVNDIPKPE